MKRLDPRTMSNLFVAAIIAAALGFGALGTQACAPELAPSQASDSPAAQSSSAQAGKSYTFRSSKRLKEHFEKHGVAMGFADAKAYEAAASAVVTNPAALHKVEREDGDDVYYLEATDEIVFVSGDGYIRTYFNPGGIDYFERQ